MHPFNQNVELILIESGWTSNRSIDITQYLNIAVSEGYSVCDEVQRFLRKFGGLRLRFDRNGIEELLHFDAGRAMLDMDSSWIKKDYSVRLQTNDLCPIGQAFSNHLTILMDSNGSVYGSYDDLLYFFGETPATAIEAICLNRKPVEIS